MKMPPQSLRVLLLHPELQVRMALAEALPEFLVVGVADRLEALGSFDHVRPHFVVACHSSARRLLKDLDRQGSEALPVFICPPEDARAVSELADVAAEGHVFHTLNGSGEWPDIAQNLRRLLFMRDSARAALSAPLDARFGLNREEFRAGCVDVGNRGIALHLPVDERIERFAPGVVISDLLVFNPDGTALLSRPRATVRRITLDTSRGAPSFKIGLTLDAADATSEGGAVLADPVRVLALVRRAARRKTPVTLTSARGKRFLVSVTVQPEDSTADCLILKTPLDARFLPGEVLDLSFDFGGEAFRGLVSALHVGPGALAVALPTSLVQVHRRSLLRFHPPPTTPFVVSFESPVDGTPILRPVLDIHAGGLSFPFDADREVLPLGLIIPEIRVTLPSGQIVQCRGEVRDVRTLPSDDPRGGLMLHPFRCGLKLSEVPARMRAEIADTSIRVRFPILRNGHTVPFSRIWELMGEAGQYFPEYPPEVGPHVDQLERVHHILANSEGEVARSYVAFDEGRPRGFIAGLRAYSRTWLVQHLAVAPGYHRHESASRDLCTLIAEWAESLEDVEYVRNIWRTENRWANRVFGWLARTMRRNSALTKLSYTNYLILEPNHAIDACERTPVREGTAADAAWLEQHLRTAGRLVEMRSDDLTARDLHLIGLGSRFAEHGLLRTRQMLVVDGEREPQAIALVERSTPGLCWPELTNSFRVMRTCTDPGADAAVRALAIRCAGMYREGGRQSVVALAADDDVAAFQALGYQLRAHVAEFTFHRSLIRSVLNAYHSVFERVARRERAMKPPAPPRDGTSTVSHRSPYPSET